VASKFADKNSSSPKLSDLYRAVRSRYDNDPPRRTLCDDAAIFEAIVRLNDRYELPYTFYAHTRPERICVERRSSQQNAAELDDDTDDRFHGGSASIRLADPQSLLTLLRAPDRGGDLPGQYRIATEVLSEVLSEIDLDAEEKLESLEKTERYSLNLCVNGIMYSSSNDTFPMSTSAYP